MKTLKCLLLSALVLVTFRAATAQDSTSGWQLVEIQNVRAELGEALGDPSVLDGAALSPDGGWLAVATVLDAARWVWLYRFDRQIASLFDVPTDFLDLPRALAWSPDGTRLVFTEDISYLLEPDIWMVEPDDETVIHITDDGVTGYVFKSSGLLFDAFPIWENNENLLFLRADLTDEVSTTAPFKLYRLTLESGEVKTVHTLDNTITLANLAIAPSLSPDGTQLALVAYRPPETMQGTVSILNLTDRSLTQVATIGNLQVGLPQGYEGIFAPQQIAWAKGGLVLYLAPLTGYDNLLTLHPVYLSLESGEVTPLADLSDVTSPQALMARGADGKAPIFREPRAGAVSPNGETFFFLHYYTFEGDYAALSAMRLPPDGSPPTLLGEITDFDAGFPPDQMSISADGTVLFAHGYRFVLESQAE